jgi:hypothetical protein
MINLDFMQFDQTNLWFFFLSALGLLRERRVLPFLIVILGNLIHGALPAALLAGLILWHRIDLPSPKWVQLKDAVGLFFIFAASVAPEPFQSFCICAGILAFSLSFGKGALGVIPPVLLLRQFVSHPADLEILMGIAGLYWVAAEGLRFSKTAKESVIRSIFEVICSLGILIGLKEVFLKWTDDPNLIGVGAGLAVFMLAIAAIVHFRTTQFWSFYRRSKVSLSKSLTFGNRFISSSEPWGVEPEVEDFSEIQVSFDRLFFVSILTMVLLIVFYLVSHGGVS